MLQRNFIKFIIFLAGIFFVDSLVADEAKDNLKTRIANKALIAIGTEGNYPPFSYHDENGRLTGYDVEIALAVAKKLGITILFKEIKWSEMLPALDSHRIDLIANQTELTSEKRLAKYEHSIPYSYSDAVVIINSDDNRIHDWSDIRGLNAAQELNSIYAYKAKKWGSKVVFVDGFEQALMLLQQKKVDFIINDKLAVLDFMQRNPDTKIKIALYSNYKIPIGFLFNKGNREVIEKFNSAIDVLRSDGTLSQIGKKFFGSNVSIK